MNVRNRKRNKLHNKRNTIIEGIDNINYSDANHSIPIVKSKPYIEIIPKKHQSLVRLVFTDVKNAMSNYFRSQFVIAMIVGVLFAVGFKIIGLPLAILLGLLIGLLNMVPYLQIIGIIPAAILAFIHSIETQQDFYVVLLFVLLVIFDYQQ